MNAILLAAGMGTRLRPLTNRTPKSLIKVKDEPVIERQIRFLLEIGVSEIIIVTGYLNNCFDYLKEKYSCVKLIQNDYYNKYNNIYSMYLAKDFLDNSFVLEADVFLANNILKRVNNNSTYYVRYVEDINSEWGVRYDKTNKINDIFVTSKPNYILSGISYWKSEETIKLKELICKYIDTKDCTDLFWDNIVKDNIDKMNVYATIIESNSCREIDTFGDIDFINKNFK